MNNVEQGHANNLAGSISEAAILFALVQAEFNVLKPFSQNSRFDFAIYKDGAFTRIQCKTGTIKDEIITFRPFSSNKGKRQGYQNEADFFMVYVKELNKIYMIDCFDCGGSTKVKFHLNPKSKQAKRAEDFEFKGTI